MNGVFDPSATDDLVDHADWFEFTALKSGSKSCSIEDLVQTLQRAGTAEEIIDETTPKSGSEKCQTIAEDAFSELENRASSCGDNDEKYPFEPNERFIQLRPKSQNSVYIFLLLLSKLGKDAGPKGSDGSVLFEKICMEVASTYFGGGKGVEKYHFGAPRRDNPSKFKDAVNDLCAKLGEGVGCREDRPKLSDQKDSKLDLIVWRPFLDGRKGKLIGFGQCATGSNWRTKLSELLPRTFCGLWLKEVLPVEPIRLFFVPFRVGEDVWMESVLNGGIFFDRCRIISHCESINKDLKKECKDWITFVLAKHFPAN